VAFAEPDRQNGTTSIVYGNPFYDHVAALPLDRPGEFVRSCASLCSRTSSAFDASSLSKSRSISPQYPNGIS
jgi:hypothetical protein